MAKRKAGEIDRAPHDTVSPRKAPKVERSVETAFAQELFLDATRTRYTKEYAASAPYKHAVVSPLIADDLLRAVREEVVKYVNFTPKETDIYKIHQSGDLANLSALESSSLQKLPKLLELRDSLYSSEFRQWIAGVAGSGPLSGRKTDMAINVYVPGCHLLCHDDVIGTRRVSYILYLTDPETPWQASWGGALRLHSTDEVKGRDGKTYKVPRSNHEKSIPPAWNQLSFFTVQPGESFHDVQEVYRAASDDQGDDGGRIRMAISGWYHIPQKGEEGFEPGLEEKLAERSSLAQLQGKADELDAPQVTWRDPARDGSEPEVELTEDDLQFLIKYITPDYLTPDTVEQLNQIFVDESTLQLTEFLSKKFSAELKEQLNSDAPALPWQTATPPHKQRFQFINADPLQTTSIGSNPYTELLHELLPSLAFRKWLALVTDLTLTQCSALARRFRRGIDYQLAQEYNGEEPQLEYTLCVTPSSGWIEDEGATGKASTAEDDNIGGYELYMAGDDLDDDQPINGAASQTGAGNRKSARAADPAIYQAAKDDEDDGILFTNPASWNTLSIVLRDRGVLRFVKYVSKAAQGDRWDYTGAYQVADEDEDADEEFAGFED